MFTERTSVGLDVHARSVAAAAIDGVTGELFQSKLTPAHDHIRSWIQDLPGPVAPSLDQEAARDLVRAREDARGDLMRARHRLSKLLLRQGIVYNGGQAWTAKHDAWLRRQHFGPGRDPAHVRVRLRGRHIRSGSP